MIVFYVSKQAAVKTKTIHVYRKTKFGVILFVVQVIRNPSTAFHPFTAAVPSLQNHQLVQNPSIKWV